MHWYVQEYRHEHNDIFWIRDEVSSLLGSAKNTKFSDDMNHLTIGCQHVLCLFDFI